MAKKSRRLVEEPEDPAGPPEADPYNAIDEEARPGETMEDYMERRDEDESKWEGKHGGRGAKTHDGNESRRPEKFDEFYDPHMGNL